MRLFGNVNIFTLVNSPGKKHNTEYDHQQRENYSADDIHGVRGCGLSVLIKAVTRDNETNK